MRPARWLPPAQIPTDGELILVRGAHTTEIAHYRASLGLAQSRNCPGWGMRWEAVLGWQPVRVVGLE